MAVIWQQFHGANVEILTLNLEVPFQEKLNIFISSIFSITNRVNYEWGNKEILFCKSINLENYAHISNKKLVNHSEFLREVQNFSKYLRVINMEVNNRF